MFLDGKSAGQIKAELEKNGVKTYRGKSEWQPKLITTMLQNEKYCGDVMHQKTYCVDCISKRKKINKGKKTKYLVPSSFIQSYIPHHTLLLRMQFSNHCKDHHISLV